MDAKESGELKVGLQKVQILHGGPLREKAASEDREKWSESQDHACMDFVHAMLAGTVGVALEFGEQSHRQTLRLLFAGHILRLQLWETRVILGVTCRSFARKWSPSRTSSRTIHPTNLAPEVGSDENLAGPVATAQGCGPPI